MRYYQSPKYRDEIENMEAVLTLLNLRDATIQGYLQTLFECCSWFDEECHISLKDADFLQLRRFLLYLHKPMEEGGRGLKPRSVNVYNSSIKKYFFYVLRNPISNAELPYMKLDHVLPKVPSRREVHDLIMGTVNVRNRMILALGFGCALRLNEVLTLRFQDISFANMQVTIRAENSKNRSEGRVELPKDLKAMLIDYYLKCRRGAQPSDYLFPGRKPGSHLSDGAVQSFLKKRLEELGWQNRGFHFHSLRHAHALFYYQNGADLFQVQTRLRHNTVASTIIYVQLDAELKGRTRVAGPFDDAGYQI